MEDKEEKDHKKWRRQVEKNKKISGSEKDALN